jgi:hypothetical protein
MKDVHRGCGDYQAVANTVVRNVNSGEGEYTCGLGRTPDEALLNGLANLCSEVDKQGREKRLTEQDFVFDHRVC